jgi:small subunit ribosomal protein S16
LLRIRLTRVGKKKQPAYRLIVTDSRSPRDGAFLKIIGHYNPLTEPVTLVVKEDEAVHWLEKGAQPSETAAKLLTRIGVMERAGRAPVRYVGKDVPAAPKKEAKAVAEPKAAPAPPEPKAAQPKAAEPVAEASDETPAAEAKTETEEPSTEAQEETPETVQEPEPATKEDAEAASEPEPEPEATSDEQPQEPAESQE